MTSPPGYTRSRVVRERAIDRAWAALRVASAREAYLSTAEIAEAAVASRSAVKRLVQAARDRGWIDVIVDDCGGAVERHAYRLTADAPADAPVLRLEDRGAVSAIAPSGQTGAALRRLRLERGWSLAETARQIGVADTRTVRRYEACAQLPPAIAERVAAQSAQTTPRRSRTSPS
jgi:hypothetical protein